MLPQRLAVNDVPSPTTEYQTPLDEFEVPQNGAPSTVASFVAPEAMPPIAIAAASTHASFGGGGFFTHTGGLAQAVLSEVTFSVNAPVLLEKPWTRMRYSVPDAEHQEVED